MIQTNHCFLILGQCQLSENTPPSMYMDRNWQIPDNEPIGSKIVQVHGSDLENDNLTYGLQPIQFFGSDKPPDPLPFRIDPHTGAVYLNDSVKGKVSKKSKRGKESKWNKSHTKRL